MIDVVPAMFRYDACKAPRRGEGIWRDPIAAVLASLPKTFERKQWATAVEKAAPHASSSALALAGAACAWLWSKTPMNRLTQQVRPLSSLARRFTFATGRANAGERSQLKRPRSPMSPRVLRATRTLNQT